MQGRQGGLDGPVAAQARGLVCLDYDTTVTLGGAWSRHYGAVAGGYRRSSRGLAGDYDRS